MHSDKPGDARALSDRAVFSASAKDIASNRLPEDWSWVASSKMARVASCMMNDKRYYLKLFLSRSGWESLKALFRGSRCQRAIQASAKLQEMGIDSPAVVASGQSQGMGWMVTEGVDAIGLADYFHAFLQWPMSSKRLLWKRCVVRELGRFVGKLHRNGVVHGDLRLNNILIDVAEATPTFYLIDNERNEFFQKKIPLKLVVKNLVQVGMIFPQVVSVSDRMRFFKAYQAELDCANDTPEVLMRRVLKKTHERLISKVFTDTVGEEVDLGRVANVPD